MNSMLLATITAARTKYWLAHLVVKSRNALATVSALGSISGPVSSLPFTGALSGSSGVYGTHPPGSAFHLVKFIINI